MSAEADMLIQLAEARISQDLRVNEQTTTTDLTIPSGESRVALPADFLEMRSVAGTYKWRPVSTMVLEEARSSGSTDFIYSIRGGFLYLPYMATENIVLTLTYYARWAPIATSGGNWLLTNYPGVYLWRALAEGAVYRMDDAQIPICESKYRQEVEAVKASDNNASYAGAELQCPESV